MPTYRFYVDQKVAVWERSIYDIEAECFEDAAMKAEKLYEESSHEEEDGFIETETLYDSMQNVPPSVGNPTKELIYYCKESEDIEIKNNGI